MGIREAINQRSGVATGVTIAVIVVILALLFWQTSRGHEGQSTGKTYYSDDDGATYFSDAEGKLAPFDHNGKQALVAHVFKCKDGAPFVAYLERVSPKGRAAIEQKLPNQVDAREFKKPGTGDKGWVGVRDARMMEIITVTCPGGIYDVNMVSP